MAKRLGVTAEKEKDEKKEVQQTTNQVIQNAIDWFNRLGNDDIRHAAVCTCKLIQDSVGIVYLDEMWPLIPMIYDAVFESIIEFLASKRMYHKRYKIQIGKNFNIGYENIDTGSAEQEGCFMPMMEHTGTTIRLIGKTNSSKKVTYQTIDNMYAENYTSFGDIEQIKGMAMQKLTKMYTTDKDGNVVESNHAQIYLPANLIMIIFSLFHDALLMRLKMLKEADPDGDIELNVLGLYTMLIEDVESKDANYNGYYVRYEPKDIVKLTLKSDQLAGGDESK